MTGTGNHTDKITAPRVYDVTITVDRQHFTNVHGLATTGARRLVEHIFEVEATDKINVAVRDTSGPYDSLDVNSTVEDGVDVYINILEHSLTPAYTYDPNTLYQRVVAAMTAVLYATGYNSYLVTVNGVPAYLPRNSSRCAERLKKHRAAIAQPS